ncbi:hypothetical protein FALCPG4_004439 [Fusarium falciforme]
MNYASVVFAGFGAISAVWYLVYARKHFKGPIIVDMGAEEYNSNAVTDAEHEKGLNISDNSADEESKK